MRGLAWKIALLTAVLAVGFLVILQAQRGMTQAMLQKEADAQAAAKSPTAAAAVSDEVAASTSAPKADSFGDPTPTHDAAAAALNGPNGDNSKTGNDIRDGATAERLGARRQKLAKKGRQSSIQKRRLQRTQVRKRRRRTILLPTAATPGIPRLRSTESLLPQTGSKSSRRVLRPTPAASVPIRPKVSRTSRHRCPMALVLS